MGPVVMAQTLAELVSKMGLEAVNAKIKLISVQRVSGSHNIFR